MPAHLFVFLFAYFLNVCTYGRLFYLDIPNWRLALSFIGMDCYAAWIIPTYAITGEWFLGAILIAYGVYPVLRLGTNCRVGWIKYAVLGILVFLYAVVLRVDFYGLIAENNPVTCLLCFYIGMLASQHPDAVKSKGVAVAAFLVCVILFAVPMGGETASKMIVAGCAALVVLYHIGKVFCRNEMVSRVVREISALSYSVFLIHHRIIVKILEGFDSQSTLHSLGALLAVVVSTLVFAKILSNLMNAVFSSKSYTKFEDLFLKGKKE